MSIDIKLRVTEIQRFCMHDGPGVRTTVFLKGCPLQCRWCHNPETQAAKPQLLFYPSKCIGCGGCIASCPREVHALDKDHLLAREKCALCGECVKNCPTGALEICGRDLTVEEILTVAERDRAFYGEDGGVTLSGGEPFAEGSATVELLKELKSRGFSTAVETCGYADPRIILAAAPYVDIFLWDVKDTDSARHRQYTGTYNERILENLALVNETNARIRLRCILVRGVNTDGGHYSSIAEIARRINRLDGIELIPYHAYGGTKSVFLGGEDSGRKEWIPTDEDMETAKDALKRSGIHVI